MESNSASPFDIEGYLRRQSSLIDQALEVQLGRYPGEPQTLFQALHYGVFSGGERIRPILTLAAAEIFDADTHLILPFACAVELIHIYSLIHDDLPTLDDLRHGKATVHKLYGERIALLARETDVDLPMIEMIHVRQTGALILASVRIGAPLGGASDGNLASLSRYGEYLGVALQIADDLLDANAGVAVEYPAESSRMERNKATYPSVAGVVTARERLAELLQLTLRELDDFELRGEPLAAIARYIVGRAIHLDAARPH